MYKKTQPLATFNPAMCMKGKGLRETLGASDSRPIRQTTAPAESPRSPETNPPVIPAKAGIRGPRFRGGDSGGGFSFYSLGRRLM